MEEKELTYKDVPTGYPLCFNDECTKKVRNPPHTRSLSEGSSRPRQGMKMP